MTIQVEPNIAANPVVALIQQALGALSQRAQFASAPSSASSPIVEPAEPARQGSVSISTRSDPEPWEGQTAASVDEWDFCWIGTARVPGLVTVEVSLERRVDSQLVPGESGSSQTHLGYGGAKVTIKAVMWTRKHLEQFRFLAKAIMPRKGERDPAALKVSHPALAIWSITALTLMRVRGPERGQEPGIWEAELEFEEFIPESRRQQTKPKRIVKATGGGRRQRPTATAPRGTYDLTSVDRTPPSKRPVPMPRGAV